MYSLSRSNIPTYKTNLPTFLRLLHLPCIMMLVVHFSLILENIVATIDLHLEFTSYMQLLIILNLFGYLRISFVFVILRID